MQQHTRQSHSARLLHSKRRWQTPPHLNLINLTVLIRVLISIKLDSHPNVIIQGVPWGARLLIRLRVVCH